MNVLDLQTMKDEGRKMSKVIGYDYSSAWKHANLKGSRP